MAKFELSVYDATTEEVIKVHKRNFMPVSLYIRFQQLAEKLEANKVKSDAEMFAALKDLFCETFPELTEKEYNEQTDIAEVLIMFRDILEKSTHIATAGDSKNA